MRVPVLVLSASVVAGLMAAELARSCFGPAPEATAELSFQVSPGQSRLVEASLFVSEEKTSCVASMSVPFSAFPTSRLATRPVEVARALRELAALWEVDECTVYVMHQNDTQEDYAEHELCLMESFSFDGARPRSVSSEANCWEPIDPELLEGQVIELA